MLKNEKLKKFMLYLFIGFMIVQPIFDIFWLYSDGLIAIFKFSPSTIIRMLIMVVLFITRKYLKRLELQSFQRHQVNLSML